ncbi:hypothetical protein FR943_20235 [Mycobacterium sp. TNTM28]|uniref:Uncharacterized protein n=1 Tax=[Mycobacterium] fortunisiensis TaxID=2600579 RepID=A0ABS6KRP6_9MYCO|nr:hypothetical protein [[Mycobacterium] fortunisiensis]MBU9766159.1 hypothetical protein [[Mycobacterium] fortunisiensis]
MTADERNKRTRYAMAGVGAIALAITGALGTMVAQPSIGGAQTVLLPAANLGETVTRTATPSELETSVAKPTVKVKLPKGYGNG